MSPFQPCNINEIFMSLFPKLSMDSKRRIFVILLAHWFGVSENSFRRLYKRELDKAFPKEGENVNAH